MGMRISFAEPFIDEQERRAVFKAMGGRFREERRDEKGLLDDDPDRVGQTHSSTLCLTNGGNVRAFEERFMEFTGGGEAHAVSSCMAALHICCMNMIAPGDKVIVPALTHPATAMAVSLAGGEPVFIDVSRETGNMEPDEIRANLTKNTRAIMVLHYLGRPANMPEIMAIARQHELYVIEDCALAVGSFIEGTHVGLWGHAGCFSFYPAKHITTGEGGMVLTRHPEIGEDAVMRRHFGQKHVRGMGLLTAVPDWLMVGMNYRMTEMQGAMGVEQMKKLPKILLARQQNYRLLSEKLNDLEQISSGGYSHYGLSVFVPNRDEVQAELKRRNIEASVYYKTPVPHTRVYAEGHEKGQFPNAEAISENTICLPVGPHVTPKGVEYMASTLKDILI